MTEPYQQTIENYSLSKLDKRRILKNFNSMFREIRLLAAQPCEKKQNLAQYGVTLMNTLY